MTVCPSCLFRYNKYSQEDIIEHKKYHSTVFNKVRLHGITIDPNRLNSLEKSAWKTIRAKDKQTKCETALAYIGLAKCAYSRHVIACANLKCSMCDYDKYISDWIEVNCRKCNDIELIEIIAKELKFSEAMKQKIIDTMQNGSLFSDYLDDDDEDDMDE